MRPLRDDKILADWNGLMIAGLARAGSAFDEPPLVAAGEAAARFITSRMRSPDGGLLHRYRDGESAIEGFADDYAFVAWGLLELYEATFAPAWLDECRGLVDYFIEHFWDRETGGFFSAMGEETARRKSFTDGVLPSANSVGTLLLLKLNRLTGRLDYRQKAEQLISLYPEGAGAQAISFSFFLSAADFAGRPGLRGRDIGRSGLAGRAGDDPRRPRRVLSEHRHLVEAAAGRRDGFRVQGLDVLAPDDGRERDAPGAPPGLAFAVDLVFHSLVHLVHDFPQRQWS